MKICSSLPRAAQEAPREVQEAPKAGQVRSKIGPRTAQEPPRAPKEAPRSGPGTAPERPGAAQEWTRGADAAGEAPGGPKEALKRPPREPKELPERPPRGKHTAKNADRNHLSKSLSRPLHVRGAELPWLSGRVWGACAQLDPATEPLGLNRGPWSEANCR